MTKATTADAATDPKRAALEERLERAMSGQGIEYHDPLYGYKRFVVGPLAERIAKADLDDYLGSGETDDERLAREHREKELAREAQRAEAAAQLPDAEAAVADAWATYADAEALLFERLGATIEAYDALRVAWDAARGANSRVRRLREAAGGPHGSLRPSGGPLFPTLDEFARQARKAGA